jgi:uncharacterized protein YbcC (UPF0753/DUF2309 family)
MQKNQLNASVSSQSDHSMPERERGYFTSLGKVVRFDVIVADSSTVDKQPRKDSVAVPFLL